MLDTTNRPADEVRVYDLGFERCSAAELKRRSDLIAANPCRYCGDRCTAGSVLGVCAFCECTPDHLLPEAVR